jgi:hypothetical protein
MTSVMVAPRARALVFPSTLAGYAPLLAATPLQHNGRNWLAAPHTGETVRLLRNLGVSAPAPVLHYYDWAGGAPFEAQRRTVAV